MEHNAQYMEGRYRVVEGIEKVKEGYQYRVTAYDDETAREVPWHPQYIIRFDAPGVAPTLEDARRELRLMVNLMKRSIAGDKP